MPLSPSRLTARESEVLALIALGFGDRQIAQSLAIATRTASKHVEHILDKLGVENRSAAAALHSGGEVEDNFLLTRREHEVCSWVAQGKRNAEIATILGIAVKTVGKHVEHSFEKLRVTSRAGVSRALSAGS